MERQICKPFGHELDSISSTLFDILCDMEMQLEGQRFAFVGGFVRDYGARPYNDIDIVSTNPYQLETQIIQMGLGTQVPQVADEVAPILYKDPYTGSQKHIHFVDADNDYADAPENFDFTINQFALKSDMMVYAPKQSWEDMKKQVIRLNSNTLTTNTLMRGVRFSAKLGFTLTEKTRQDFLSLTEKLVDGQHREEGKELVPSNRVILNIDKIIEDGVEERSYELLRELNFPKTRELRNIHELRYYHQKLIDDNKAFIQMDAHY